MRSDLFRGRYLFHFHTTRTDGTLEIADYFAAAKTHTLDRLIFLEHMRRQPTYDPAAFVEDVRQESHATGIEAHVGFEAKLFADGSLNISDENVDRAAVIGIAEHGFAEGLDSFHQALGACLDHYTKRWPHIPFVWVHPGLCWIKRAMLESHRAEYDSALELAAAKGGYVEKNLKYDLLPDDALSVVPRENLVVGIDGHRPDDLAPRIGRAANYW